MQILKDGSDTSDALNPYSAKIKQMAKATPIDVSLCTGDVYIGVSAIGSGKIESHHILDEKLFPIPPRLGIATPRIKISQRVHVLLHQAILHGLNTGDFQCYEFLLSAECPRILIPVGKIYKRRIRQLFPTWQRSNFVSWLMGIYQRLKNFNLPKHKNAKAMKPSANTKNL